MKIKEDRDRPVEHSSTTDIINATSLNAEMLKSMKEEAITNCKLKCIGYNTTHAGYNRKWMNSNECIFIPAPDKDSHAVPDYCRAQIIGQSCVPDTKFEHVVNVTCPTWSGLSNQDSKNSVMLKCRKNKFGHTFVLAQDESIILGHDVTAEKLYNNCDYNHFHENHLFWLNTQRLIYGVCDLISTICTSLAIGIFIYFKNLHCTKNWIHVHLFFAFAING